MLNVREFTTVKKDSVVSCHFSVVSVTFSVISFGIVLLMAPKLSIKISKAAKQ